MDNDEMRRGKPSTHKKFGEGLGLLAGDALLTHAFSAMLAAVCSDDKKVRAVRYLSENAGVNGMIGGQVVDVEMTGKPLSEPQLQFVYELKTGALLEAAMMMGAVLGGASQMELRRLEGIARSIGVAFQIEDDILDETSTQEVLGKPIHSDEENNKTTWVSIHGLEAAQAEVQRLSEEAIEGLKSLSEVDEDARQFLIALTEELIHRKK